MPANPVGVRRQFDSSSGEPDRGNGDAPAAGSAAAALRRPPSVIRSSAVTFPPCSLGPASELYGGILGALHLVVTARFTTSLLRVGRLCGLFADRTRRKLVLKTRS